MSLLVNLRHLEKKNVELSGELPLDEAEWDTRDPLIRVVGPLRYDLELQRMDNAVLAQGRLEVTLHCECVRCLRPLDRPMVVEDWACLLPLTGEDAVETHGDFVDLTPYVREDIFLAFPQHPLCSAECEGLIRSPQERGTSRSETKPKPKASVWAELDKLRLNN